MNVQLVAKIREVVEQVISGMNLVAREEVQQLVSDAVTAELGLAETGTEALPAPRPIARVATAPQSSPSNRKPAQSPEERRAKRAKYQKNYRAKEKAKKDAERAATNGTPAQAAPTRAEPKAAPIALVPPPAAAPTPAPKKDNGVVAPAVAYVPDVSLDV